MQKSERRWLINRATPQLRHLFLAMLIVACTSGPAAAHAVLVDSSPVPESTSSGPNIAIRLRFNVRIDADRSRITIIRSDGSGRKLETLKGAEPNTLTASATGLEAGAYRIRWQVLASDGHLTSGEIHFSVGG
jgi:copper resistance protein C